MHFQGLALVFCIKHRILLLEACLSLHTSRAFSRSSSLAAQLVVNPLPSGCPSCVSLCVLLASQVDMADSVGAIFSISPRFCQPFWWPPIGGGCFCVFLVWCSPSSLPAPCRWNRDTLRILLRMRWVAMELTAMSWCCSLHICYTLGWKNALWFAFGVEIAVNAG